MSRLGLPSARCTPVPEQSADYVFDTALNAKYDSNYLSPFSPTVLARLVTLALTAGILLAGVVVIIYLLERDHEASLLQQQGHQRVDREFEFLIGQIESVRSDVLYLSEQALLRRFLAGDEGARDELEHEYVRFATRRSVYDQIRFLDTEGKEVVRVNFRDGKAEIVAEDELQPKSDRYYYRDAMKLQPGEVFVSRFDLNVEHGQIERPLEPVLRFLTPVVDDTGRTRGLVALNYNGEHLLGRLNELSLPGSTLLINSAGQYIRGLTSDDAWGWLLGHTHTFEKQFPQAWKRISSEPEGQFVTAEGMFTFRRVSFSASLTGPETPTAVASDRDGDPTRLILVGFLPPAMQSAASTKLLKQLMWMYAGAMVVIATFGWYWARSAAIRKQQAKSIMASESRLRTLSDQLMTAQEEERRSISRELHDQLGQQVTAISLDLRSAARQQDAARAQSLLDRAIEETDHLLKSLHEVASRLRPSVLDDLGLHDAVESLTSEISRRTDVSVTTNLDIRERSVSPKIGENVYRILQEGLMNVVKHAEAKQAAVTIQVEADQLHMTLEDSGIGFDTWQRDASRLGILGMRERTELLGGQFSLSSAPGSGTRVEVSIPLRNGDLAC